MEAHLKSTLGELTHAHLNDLSDKAAIDNSSKLEIHKDTPGDKEDFKELIFAIEVWRN